MGKFLVKFFLFLFLYTLYFILYIFPAYATTNPLSVPNNKFGIHIISPSPDEASPAASLVNTNGDWGYVTVIIEQKDKKKDKWQEFFNDLRRRHLIPIVRLATETSGTNWLRPNLEDANSWADFLNSLNWPVKNRYVVVFNEPNQGKEWGGVVDAKSYAQALDKIITALKSENEDFFVLNGGFDASAPNQPPNFEDEAIFLQQMNQAVPGIFEKLDGWVSHSYPNPGFVGSPQAYGRGSVRTWYWEKQLLKNLGVLKDLPIFITETGWKHAEGLNYNPNYPPQDQLSSYYQTAFEHAWTDAKIVAITPFLLNYQETPFDHFSFKKLNLNPIEDVPNSGAYYAFFDQIKNMPKTTGQPTQALTAQLTHGEVYSSIVAGQSYNISLTFKNTGQSIWGDPLAQSSVQLQPVEGSQELGIQSVAVSKGAMVEPNKEYTFVISLKAPQKGIFNIKLNLFEGNKQFASKPVEFTTEVKLPVILQILSKLKWKDSSAGDYILKVSGASGDSAQTITLDNSGKSEEIEAKYLLPDYGFNFTLEKPYYHPKTITQIVKPGINTLDFGELQPTLLQAIFNPQKLWQLLPFSH